MSQQGQTLEYFKTHADDWNKKASDEAYSLVENRHKAVLEVMKGYAAKSSILDVGCGTGQLAIEASLLGWDATGVDFAQEMVDICLDNNSKSDTKAKFICSSIFETKLKNKSYDVVSAQGFIEYISLQQLGEFLDLVHKLLKDEGAIALGSRNRLFNLNTLNSFTDLEVSLGTINKLIKEGIILQSSASQDEAIKELRELHYEYRQPTEHPLTGDPLTGVKVDTRYQFSPADLITKLENKSFEVKKIYPVHFHPLPVSMLSEGLSAEIHKQLAKLASVEFIDCQKIIPFSSSFVIEARKV